MENIKKDPEASICKSATKLEIARPSLRRILKKHFLLFLYKMQIQNILHQNLTKRQKN